MSIRFNCSRCGKPLVAPEGTTGKKTTCPKCNTKQLIPEGVYEAESVDDGGVGAPGVEIDDGGGYELERPGEAQERPTERKRPCPMCGEQIMVSAIKCRYCGEIFDPALRRSASRRRGDEDTDLTGVELTFCILCSGIGCIWGLIYLIQGKSTKGGKMIGISILCSVIIQVLLGILGAALENGR
jgi:DNA-directed RNA polymerase subunit RPC12/RpoP